MNSRSSALPGKLCVDLVIGITNATSMTGEAVFDVEIETVTGRASFPALRFRLVL